MTTFQIISLIAIFVLLVISAFFSGSETALTASSKARVKRMASGGKKSARLVEKLLEDKERLIGGILLGNNLVNILASALATGLLISIFGDQGVAIATVVMTTLVLVFAEVLPKTYAISNPDKMALSVAPLINFFIRIFSPIVVVVQNIVRVTLKAFGIDTSNVEYVLSGQEELRGAFDVQLEEGRIFKTHKDMLESILDLDEILVEEIMIHRKNMVMLNFEDTPDAIIGQAVAKAYSRYPLYQGHRENIVGVLHTKDILIAIRKGERETAALSINKIMTKPWFVPETTTLREQLDAFLKRRVHFALVVDEYGVLMGLITLEDILEEIVGDIRDEHDQKGAASKRLKGGGVLVSGEMTIRDLNRKYGWDLPDEEAATIAGLVIHVAEIIPFVGQKFSFKGLEFEVKQRRKNQITKIKITKVKKKSKKN
ncbi:MAG: HlyC/CorC family transporter [Proteobacteria bacterium]|nr:HlyC/CorC family transporter [Pseudomonadota bacterium]